MRRVRRLFPPKARRVTGLLRAVCRDRRGASAIEFAIMGTVYCIVLAGVVNVSGAVYIRFQIETAVASAQSYALQQAANVNSTSAAALGASLARLAHHAAGTIQPESDIDVNDGAEDQDPETTSGTGPWSSTDDDGDASGDVVTASGTASQADSCYCPTVAGNAVTWGTAKTCGSTCSSGGLAGKYVFIKAVATYTPLIPVSGVITSSTLTCATLTRVK